MCIQRVFLISLVLLWSSLSHSLTGSEKERSISLKPSTQKGQKWRIGYYEGGSYISYQKSLSALSKALMKLGWIEKAPLPVRDGQRTYPLWQWLSLRSRSQYLEFVEDAYFNAGWDMTERSRIRKRVLKRLKRAKDVDLMIAMGTWAGQDLATHLHPVPTMVMSSSDPLKSGIVKSIPYSGFDHVFAKVDPNRFKRQIRLFHDLISFKRLGVAFENTQVGKSYAALDDIEFVAKKRKFKIEKCFTKSDIPDQKHAEKTVIACFHSFANKVDAIYVTEQGGITEDNIGQLAKIANDYHIPTFSQAGSGDVKKGILLSLSQENFDLTGQFYAENMIKIFNGELSGSLNQIFEVPSKIAINLKTAEMIGLYLKTDILSAADEIYKKIDN